MKQREFYKTVGWLTLLFAVFYWLYVLFFGAIHAQPQPDRSLFNPWIVDLVAKEEGSEVSIVFAGLLVYIGLCLVVIRNLKRLPWFAGKLGLLAFLPLVFVVANTRSYTFSLADIFANVLIAAALLVGIVLALKFSEKKLSSGERKTILSFLFFAFLAVVVLSLAPPKPFDYGFFIGPTLKLLQGERLGSFYLQYNVLGTLLFALMMGQNLWLHQMQLVLAIIFSLWFILYYQLAKRIIKEQYLVLLFMIALFVVRFLVIKHDPVFIPQVSPIRLDLWVPLALIVFRFGFLSVITAGAFSAMYLLDNFFGLLYFLLYLAFLTVGVIGEIRKRERGMYRKLFSIALPIVASVALQVLIFGSPITIAGTLYQNVGLGFLPITKTSPFWIIVATIPVSLFLFLEKKNKTYFLFLVCVLIAQLVYFLGRSHDHNLLNISGIVLLVWFASLALLHSYLSKRTIVVLATFIILAPAFIFSQLVVDKFERFESRILRGVLFDEHSIDKQVEQAKDLFSSYPDKERIVLMSSIDSYLNYRFRLRQVGYFAPFAAHVFVSETIDFLTKLVEDGYHVIFWGEDMLDTVTVFNQSDHLKQKGLRFIALQKGSFSELGIATRSASLEDEASWLRFSHKIGVAFRFPKTFTVATVSPIIRLVEENGSFIIEFEPDQRTNETEQQYLSRQTKEYGVLLKQGSADIPTVKEAFVRFWNDRGVKKLEFFLFSKTKTDSVLKVRVWPADSAFMGTFNRIINTLNF